MKLEMPLRKLPHSIIKPPLISFDDTRYGRQYWLASVSRNVAESREPPHSLASRTASGGFKFRIRCIQHSALRMRVSRLRSRDCSASLLRRILEMALRAANGVVVNCCCTPLRASSSAVWHCECTGRHD